MKTPNQEDIEYWRQRILNLKPAKIISKKVKSPFLPVIVSSDEVKMQSYSQQQKPSSAEASCLFLFEAKGLSSE